MGIAAALFVVGWAGVGALAGTGLRAATVAWPRETSLRAALLSCPGCGRLRRRRELVPLLGALRELRAAACPEARRRLLTEVAAAALLCWAASHGFGWPALVLTVYALLFLLIIGIDIERRLILNRVLLAGAAAALLAAAVLPDMTLGRALVGGALGFACLMAPALLAPGGLGAGDVKLAGFLGLAIGFPGILAALVAGVILGGVTTAALMLTGRLGRRDYVPYGPFLVAGACLLLAAW